MSSSNSISLAEAIETLGMNENSQGLRWVSEKKKENNKYIYLSLEKAEDFNAKAVYFRFFSDPDRPPRPQVYIYDSSETHSEINEAAEIHHRLWNAGIVPYCFIFHASQILVYNCGLKPSWNEYNANFTTKAHDIINVLSKTQKKINQYHAKKFDSGLFWDSDANKKFTYGQSAYEQLLNQLKNAKSNIIEKVGKDKAVLVKRVLMMLILIKYLEERKDENGTGALNPVEFYKQYNPDNPSLEGVLEKTDTIVEMLSDLSSEEHFNGQIFNLNSGEIKCLNKIDLNIFQMFVRGDATIFSSTKYGLGQLSFWRLYQFNYLPIELISHIYEDFLADENGNKKKGVVYTPPYLVQFLIDQTMPLNVPKEQFKVLDPACGSGIFLVGAFKRMIQWWRVRNNWQKPKKENIAELKDLLKKNIYGCDLEEEAVTITYFSLGLALLDALSPKEIWKNVHFDDLFNQNLFYGDFFKTLYENKLSTDFDLIIGNPPFNSEFTLWAKKIDKISLEENKERPPVPDNQIALLFLEQSFELLKSGGNSCLILPSGPILYNTKVHEYRKYLFISNYFKIIYDFTPLRAKLFIGSSSSAKPPVVAVYAGKEKTEDNVIQHLIFRRTKASSEKVEFEVDYYDIHLTSYESALSNPRVWQTNFMGGGRLHNLMQKISDMPTLEYYLDEKIKYNKWKVGEGWIHNPSSKPLKEIKRIKSQNTRSKKEEIRLLKLISKHEAGWITGHQFVETKDFTLEGIKETKVCNINYFYRSAKENKKIFKPPHLLIKESLKESILPVFLSYEYLTFKTKIIGVHAPIEDVDELKKLQRRLRSKFIVPLIWLLSGQVIANREGVPLKVDILSLPYPRNELDLNEIEKYLLEDISLYYSDFRKQGEKSDILNEVSNQELIDYGNIYCTILNSIYDDFIPLSPIIGNEFIAYPFILGNHPEIEIPNTITGIEEKLKRLIDNRVSYNLWVKRIIKVYHKNLILYYKPNQKRYWLRSIAVRDADDTFSELYKQGK